MRAIPARLLLRFRRRLPLRRVVPAAGAVCRVRAGCASAARYAGDRARPGAAAGFLRGTVGRRRSSADCTVLGTACRTRSVRWSGSGRIGIRFGVGCRRWRRRGRRKYWRCHVVARIGNLCGVWCWCQGIHWLQIRICITVRFGSVGLIAGRTGPPAATKRTSAFAHAVVVWLRRKVLLDGSRGPRGKLTRNPEPYSVWNSAPTRAALVQEWYYRPPKLSSNKMNGRLLRKESPVRLESGNVISTHHF